MLMTLYCLGMCCHSRRRRYRIWFQRQSSDRPGDDSSRTLRVTEL